MTEAKFYWEFYLKITQPGLWSHWELSLKDFYWNLKTLVLFHRNLPLWNPTILIFKGQFPGFWTNQIHSMYPSKYLTEGIDFYQNYTIFQDFKKDSFSSFGSCHKKSRGNQFSLQVGNSTKSSLENQEIHLDLKDFKVSGSIDSSCIPIITLKFIDLIQSSSGTSVLKNLHEEHGEYFWAYALLIICVILVLILMGSLVYATHQKSQIMK